MIGMSTVINIDAETLGNTPAFKGTRVPVDPLFDHLKHGHSLDYFLEDFPSVTREQVEAPARRGESENGTRPVRSMKRLLEENLPHCLRPLVIGRAAVTVAYQGRLGLKMAGCSRQLLTKGSTPSLRKTPTCLISKTR